MSRRRPAVVSVDLELHPSSSCAVAVASDEDSPRVDPNSGEEFLRKRCPSGLPDSYATSRVSSPSSPFYPRPSPSSTAPFRRRQWPARRGLRHCRAPEAPPRPPPSPSCAGTREERARATHAPPRARFAKSGEDSAVGRGHRR